MINAYDTLGRVKTQTNANGKVYTYYFAGSRSEEAGPLSVSNVSYLDAQGNVLRAINPLGRATVNTYDGAGRLSKSVLPEGNSVEYVYDDAPCAFSNKRCTHNVKTLTQRPKPGSSLTPLTSSFTYESSFNKPSTSKNARGKTTNYTYNATHGEIETVTAPPDVDGNRPLTTYVYTAYAASGFPNFHLPTSQTRSITAGTSVTSTTSYNASNKYVPSASVTDEGSGKLNLTTGYTYDAIGNLKSVDGPRSDVSDITQYSYDAERRLTQTTDALNKLSLVGYDLDGRPNRSAAQIGSQWLVSCTRYTATGKPNRTWGPTLTASATTCPAQAAPVPITDTAYDDQDRVQRVTQYLTAAEGGNRVTDTGYHTDGRVKTVKRAVGTDLAQTYASTTYTENGLPATITDARGYVSTLTYDGLDRRSRLYYPQPDATGASSTTDYDGYGYNASGNVTTLRRRSGEAITLAYDDLDRLTSRSYPNTADNVDFAYDPLGRRTSANLSNGSFAVSSIWDNAGRLRSTTAGGRTLGYLYDPAGNRTRITWPDTAFYVATAYDALNRPTTVKELGSTTLANYADYDELSRRKTITLGNGAASAYSYSSQGTLSAVSHNLAGSAQDVAFGYARNQAQEIINHTWNNDTYEWKLAANGMRFYTPANGLNQYDNAGGSRLSHDSKGNLTGDGIWSWTYDADNQLRSATKSGTSVALAYDATGRLRQETANGATTRFLYDGTDLVAEYDANNVLLRRHVHGPGIDEPLMTYQGTSTSNKEWLFADHLGSVVASANTAGTSTAVYSYGPFGEPNQTAGSRFRYTGQTFMPTMGLYYYKARFYSPVIGRFMQTDPIGNADDLNIYSYTGNDPINGIDPTGLFLMQVSGGVIGGAGGLIFQAGSDLWNGRLSSFGAYASSVVGGAAGGVAATVCGPACAGATAATVSNLTSQVLSGSGFSASSLVVDSAIGAAGGKFIGAVLPTAAKTYLSNATKGAIGEAMTEVGLRATGQSFTRQAGNGVGKSTFDFQLSTTGTFVESKFGTSGLSKAQRTAAQNLGDDLQVQSWNYPTVSGIATAGPAAAVGSGK